MQVDRTSLRTAVLKAARLRDLDAEARLWILDAAENPTDGVVLAATNTGAETLGWMLEEDRETGAVTVSIAEGTAADGTVFNRALMDVGIRVAYQANASATPAIFDNGSRVPWLAGLSRVFRYIGYPGSEPFTPPVPGGLLLLESGESLVDENGDDIISEAA